MSLFSTIQLANGALQAQQIGLQVAGQNIANANTPGYSREEVLFTPQPTQRVGGLLLGLGVRVEGVIQKIDRFLESRLRGAASDVASSETQEQNYKQLESIIGELNDTDLSTSINKFFSSIHEVLNQPESVSARNLAVLQGRTLAEDIGRLSARVGDIRSDLNDRVANSAQDIDRLLEEIRDLNIRITSSEAGDVSNSDAVGLRDQRNLALTNLAKLIEIRVDEQPSGATNVFSGGDFLVFEGTRRHVANFFETDPLADQGLSAATVRIVETGTKLGATSGELAGLSISRDQILGGFLENLDDFARTLAFEFNKVYTSGQGLKGFQSLTGEFAVEADDLPLDAAGMPFTPVNGGFQIQVYNTQTGLTHTTDIRVDLNGLDDNDTTLASLAASIDAVEGVSAAITADNRLAIRADSSIIQISFANDTSGALAALGLNTFFTGNRANNLSVSQELIRDPAKFAASQSGIGGDTANAVELAGFLDRPLSSLDGSTLADQYDRLTVETTQGSAVSQAIAQGFRNFHDTLHGQQLATSGVNLDEEAVKMITYQRTFQAAARLIATLSDLLELLVSL